MWGVSHLAADVLADGEADAVQRHLRRMRVIVDVCHNLPGGFLPERRKARERKAIESLRFRLLELDAEDAAVQWVAEQLGSLGFDYLRVLDERVKWEHVRFRFWLPGGRRRWGGVLDRDAMKARLEEIGVQADEYHLYERPHDGFYVVPMGIGWGVYRQERGVRFEQRTFVSESAACAYLVGLLGG